MATLQTACAVRCVWKSNHGLSNPETSSTSSKVRSLGSLSLPKLAFVLKENIGSGSSSRLEIVPVSVGEVAEKTQTASFASEPLLTPNLRAAFPSGKLSTNAADSLRATKRSVFSHLPQRHFAATGNIIMGSFRESDKEGSWLNPCGWRHPSHHTPPQGYANVNVDRSSPQECHSWTAVDLGVLLGGTLTFIRFADPAAAADVTLNNSYGDVGALLEVGVQLTYLGILLLLLGIGSFLVVRQVLIRRQLELAAKELQDRVRSGQASSLEYFELGAVMLRKKFYALANRYLDQAIKKWDGDEQDLAQVYNALGFCYFSDGKLDQAITQYEKAVKLQPTYVTAWNNLGDAYEQRKDYRQALKSYEEALQFDPNNRVASARRQEMKERVERFQGIP